MANDGVDSAETKSRAVPEAIQKLLNALGLSADDAQRRELTSCNLLKVLEKTHSPTASETRELLNRCLRNGAILSRGWPSDGPTEFDPAIWCWLPKGLPAGPSITFPCSRLGNRLFELPVISDAIRTTVARSHDQVFVTSPQTTLHDLLQIACHWFQRRLLILDWFPRRLNRAWFENAYHVANNDFPCYVARSGDAARIAIELDALAITIADEVRVIHVRTNGSIADLVSTRIQQTHSSASIFTLQHDSLNDSAVKTTWQSEGAVPWWLYRSSFIRSDIDSEAAGQECHPESVEPEIIPIAEFSGDNFLSHWTRGFRKTDSRGPQRERLQDFLFGGDFGGPLATLERILVRQRIMASGKLIRGSYPVVSFTGVPLHELSNRRQFQSHLARWDFEPFGLALRQERLTELGGRSVLYGNEDIWEELPTDARPFFQVRRGGKGKMDWSVEREWRLVGDLDLRLLGAEDAVVFVPDRQSACYLRPISRWPIVQIDDPPR